MDPWNNDARNHYGRCRKWSYHRATLFWTTWRCSY